MSWTYTNSSNTVVRRTNADGSVESKSVEAIADWITEGNTPLPFTVDTNSIWDKIKEERDRRKAGGVKLVIGGIDKWFHSDTSSRIQIFGLKDKARDMVSNGGLMSDIITILGNNVNWKTMDGSFVTMTGQLAFDIVTETGDVDAQLHAKAEWHKVQMLASATPSSYDYSGGWVAIYGEA